MTLRPKGAVLYGDLMTEILEPKPQFRSIPEDAVLAALDDPGPANPNPEMITATRTSQEGKPVKDGLCRILSLDGGGAKGFYTLGVLREIEGMIGRPLHERFDLLSPAYHSDRVACRQKERTRGGRRRMRRRARRAWWLSWAKSRGQKLGSS